MKTRDFTVINDLTIGVTTVSFSKDEKLLNYLKSLNFKKIKTNDAGERFSLDGLITFLKDCDAAIVGLDKIDETVLKSLPKLKVISKYGVGLDNINFEDCLKHNVRILHSQGVNKRSVAEMALGFMLSLCRNINSTSNLLKNGVWHKNGGTQLSGKTIGIIGVGNVGKDLVELLKPFKCKILVNDIIDQTDYYKSNMLVEISKETLFKQADIISIHTPLTAQTRHLINKNAFALMKPNAVIINTARGGIVNENDLKDALVDGAISGAAIDVYETEPPDNIELLALPNLINTPHIAGNSIEAVEAMGMASVENIIKYYEGN